MTEPMPEPTHQSARAFTPPPLMIRIGDRKWPGMTLTFGGVECVPRDDWDTAVGEIQRLREDLRQQQLRQQLAEREATDLRAERDAVEAAALDHAWVEATWRAEVERLRGLLGEALHRWSDADGSGGGRMTGQDQDDIRRMRREAGLT